MTSCERCARERWWASTPEAFDPAKHCLAHSGALHQLQACAAKEMTRSRALLERYRALAKAADAMRAVHSNVGLFVYYQGYVNAVTAASVRYDADRAAVREIEEGSPKRPGDGDT